MSDQATGKTEQSNLSYKDKVVIITGGSKGIGRGCATVFCRAGAVVVICARNISDGERVADELTRTCSGNCVFHQCDVTEPQQIKDLIDWTISKYGRLDCLINNAGYAPTARPIDDFSIEDFKDLLQLNLVSYFAACKFALPHLRKTSGCIINMSSLVGVIGNKHYSTYVTTKGGINALTKTLAIDEAENGVRVNAVCPAVVVTPLYEMARDKADDPQAYVNWSSSWHWLNRPATIEEIGNVCLFLASDAASFITGVELPVSGGAELGYGIKTEMPMTISL